MNVEIKRPQPGDYAAAFAGYIALVPENDVVQVLSNQSREVSDLVKGLTPAQAAYRYAPGKWTIREVIGHVADGEQVFGFRAMALARGEQSALPGFDENIYVDNADFEDWTPDDLLTHFQALRQANVQMFSHLSEQAWTRSGVVNGNHMTVPALAWVIAGHLRHHLAILRDRYLSTL